jgi:hypothetical protein
MVLSEVSLGASLLRRVLLRPTLDPGAAEAWSAALSEVGTKLLLACFLLQNRTNLDGDLVASRVQATADLIQATQRYGDLAHELGPKVNLDRHSAVLLGETKRRAESIGTYFERFVERSATLEAAEFLAQMKGWLEAVAYFDHAAHGYLDGFLASTPTRLCSRAGARRSLRHGSHINKWACREAEKTVVMTFEERRVRFVVELPGPTSASLTFECDPTEQVRLASLVGIDVRHAPRTP